MGIEAVIQWHQQSNGTMKKEQNSVPCWFVGAIMNQLSDTIDQQKQKQKQKKKHHKDIIERLHEQAIEWYHEEEIEWHHKEAVTK